MHIISRKRLRGFWKEHPDAKDSLDAWFRQVRAATWQNITEARKVYPHADAVGNCTVFNVKGNDYRLIAKIEYRIQRIYIKSVLTHAEYDKGDWKNGCRG